MSFTCFQARRARFTGAVWLCTAGMALTLSLAPDAEAARPALADVLSGEARADYSAGRILYADGDYSGAALKFQAAYDKSKNAALLWNVAAARKAERKYSEVERLVKQYLTESVDLTDEETAQAKTLLETIDAFIANLVITVNEPGATVTIDGVSAGVSPLSAPLRVDLGSRTISVQKPGFEPFERSQKVVSDTELFVSLTPEVREGGLRILSPAGSQVHVNGKRVTAGAWEGTLPSGTHSVEVSAPNKLPFKTETVVNDGQKTTLRVTLEDAQPAYISAPPSVESRGGGSSTWLWVTAGLLLLGGAAAGGYFLLKSDTSAQRPEPRDGTISPTVFIKFGP